MASDPDRLRYERDLLLTAARDVLALIRDAEGRYPSYATKVRLAGALEAISGQDVTGAARLVRVVGALQRAVDTCKE